MKNNFFDSFLLIFGVVFVFLVKETGLSSFSLQITALLFLVFFFRRFFQSLKFLEGVSFREKLEAFILNIIVLLLVSSTGDLGSPLFFLIYFLLFSVSLLLSPASSLVLAFSLIIFFLPQTSLDDPKTLIPLFSLPLIAPLAVFLGKTYLEKQKIEKELILKEEDTLIWLTTVFRQHLDKALSMIENFPPGNLDEKEKETLKNLKKGLNRLTSLGQKLKKEIEE